MATGTLVTTTRMRSECASATRSASAACRSASTTISCAPPMAVEKKAVVGSVRASRAKRPLVATPMRKTPTAAASSAGALASTSRATAGVK